MAKAKAAWLPEWIENGKYSIDISWKTYRETPIFEGTMVSCRISF